MSDVFVRWAAEASLTQPRTRLRCVEWLHNKYFTWTAAMQIENETYHANQDPQAYMRCMKALMYNFSINPELRSVTAQRLSRMTSAALCEGTVLEIATREKRIQRERFMAMLQQRYEESGAERGHSDLQCRKCRRQTPLNLEQKQTRSADEPTTVFVTCKVCSTRWRLN